MFAFLLFPNLYVRYIGGIMGKIDRYTKDTVFFMTAVVFLIITASNTTFCEEIIYYSEIPSPEKLYDSLFGSEIDGGRTKSIIVVHKEQRARKVAFKIHFDFNSWQIEREDYHTLQVVADAIQMAKNKDYSLVVEGHTDAVGDFQYNLELSQKRALSVVKFLTERCDIPSKNLIPVGKGEFELFNKGHPDAEENRRVQFYIK